MEMNKILKYIFPVCFVVLIASCIDDPKHPGYEFMPDMYRSVSYETNADNALFSDSMSNRQPVKGTVARGDALYADIDRLPYSYPDNNDGYEAAGRELRNPLEKSEENMAEGKRLYENYCTHCHGATGAGDGLVVSRNGPKPPAYNSEQLKNLPEGKMYHVVEYGKNMMGSHASQLLASQRWKIIMYIQTLQGSGQSTTTVTDSTRIETTKEPVVQTKKG
jgi:mono/diheme cytochrome c family protein